MQDSLAIQLQKSLAPRVAKLNTEVAPKIAEQIKDRALENTRNARGFSNDPYKETYSPNYKPVPRNKTRVDLRRKQKRIENMKIIAVGQRTGAVVGWSDREVELLFARHHHGVGNNPMRSIFPRSPMSIPVDIQNNIIKLVGDLLRGK
jgi:hypothetical protein